MFRWVLRPRVAASAAAAACWVAVQAFTETTVTDVMMVRTFAEEVYFQLVASPDAVPAAVAVTLPVWGLSAAVAVWLMPGSFLASGAAASRRLCSSLRP